MTNHWLLFKRNFDHKLVQKQTYSASLKAMSVATATASRFCVCVCVCACVCVRVCVCVCVCEYELAWGEDKGYEYVTLNPLTIECGTEATVGYPIWRDTAAMLAIPCRFKNILSSIQSYTEQYAEIHLLLMVMGA